MTPSAPVPGALSIGEVLGVLRPDFPDVTISKIRFLESEGLIEPARTPSGYRKFNPSDVERLRRVLALQRDRYLPLKVIRDQLDAMDAGSPYDDARPGPDAGEGDPSANVRAVRTTSEDPLPWTAAAGIPLRLTRSQLGEYSGLDPDTLAQVEGFGLLAPGRDGHFAGDALLVARAVSELLTFGIEPRHLRSFKLAADREATLIAQVVAPMLRQRNPGAPARAEETARELSTIAGRLHAVLVKSAVESELAH